jgi:predicted nuclease of predicted toxin-antitoxin system
MFAVDVAEALRAAGHDVARASEVGQSRADDDEILQKAIEEKRILVTLDEHFGDWVVLPLSRHPGVIRLRLNRTTSRNVINLLLPFLQSSCSREEFRDHLVIVSPTRVKWVHTA